MTNSPFNLSESSVATRTGLPLSEIKAARKIGHRCEKTARGAVYWSEAGVLELEAELAQKTAALPEPQPVTPVLSLRVERVRTPRVLHVTRPGEAYDSHRPLNVWLPRPMGRLFRPAMMVAAKQRPLAENVFDYAGDPARPERGLIYPRRVGQW